MRKIEELLKSIKPDELIRYLIYEEDMKLSEELMHEYYSLYRTLLAAKGTGEESDTELIMSGLLLGVKMEAEIEVVKACSVEKRNVTTSILEELPELTPLKKIAVPDVLVEELGAIVILGELLRNAEFGYVGGCGYGARLTVTLESGETLTMFKGSDGCDSIVFGSFGGYFLGDAENLEFWSIFGLDPDTKQPFQ